MDKVKTGHGWPHDVTRKDLRITHIKGSGAGGQKRNKTSSGVLIVHIPTGLTGRATEHREQSQNLKAAFRKLADQLIPLMKKEVKLERYRANPERVRTYHEPDNRVVDERIGRCGSYSDVVEGTGFADVVEELLKAGSE